MLHSWELPGSATAGSSSVVGSASFAGWNWDPGSDAEAEPQATEPTSMEASRELANTVSYTHLTLPTICSV
eukprot:14717178-Alexandrium_andersonii.AAC.1